jgi:hypothetical protein
MVATLQKPHAATLAQGQGQRCSLLAQQGIRTGLKLQASQGVSPVGIIACSKARGNARHHKLSMWKCHTTTFFVD